MTALVECSSCRCGDHSEHTRTVQSAPEGMMGGSICPCKGECESREAQNDEFSRLIADLYAGKAFA